MYRTVPYIVLFLILALLQIFLFDNLSISIYLCPLVYIGFIVLLPIDAPPVAVLFLALSMSVAMDWAMGAAGINTIATLRSLCWVLTSARHWGGCFGFLSVAWSWVTTLF